jgi:predicted membrane-bound spermidine synthase
VSTAIALFFLLGPLLARRAPLLRAPDRAERLRALLFFLCVGAGFVYVELALVQHFVMYLGHPIYALSTVLVALLLSTGAGSLLTARIGLERARKAARVRALVLAVALVLYSLLLGRVLGLAVSLPFALRLAVTLVLLAPLGLLLGSQTPLGVRITGARAAELVPWGWGLNGVASVVATAVGTLVAMHFGFRWLLVAGAGTYLLAALSVPREPEVKAEEEAPPETPTPANLPDPTPAEAPAATS